jgi:hypothetical protein
MAWKRYDILIHLGTGDVVRSTEIPHHLGIVKARTKDEAEKKGMRIARSLELSGLIEVECLGN